LIRITRDNLPYLVQLAISMIKIQIHSPICGLNAKWWGIRLGNNCRFNGLPIFRRYPKSMIHVGNFCRFNSASNSVHGGISRPCILWTLSSGAKISIGDGCGFSGTVISANCEIKLGNNVRCGTNTRIMDSDMHTDDIRSGVDKPVYIEDDVWLGANTMVMKGVTVGTGTLVGAGSLVVKSLPSHVIAAGVPAKVIRSIDGNKYTQ